MLDARTFTEPDDSHGVRAFVTRVTRDIEQTDDVQCRCRSRKVYVDAFGRAECLGCGHTWQRLGARGRRTP